MDDHDQPFCDFHPSELVVGVCAHCLRERLLVLASKRRPPPPQKSKRSFRVARRKRLIKLPKVFALGPFLYRLDSRRRRDDEDEVDDSDEGGSVASNEDSFISVKFDDGQASWDNKEAVSTGPSTSSNKGGNEVDRNNRIMVEKTKKSKGLKWKKRIRQLLRMERSKMSSDKSNWLVGFGAKGRKSWIIGSLTRRRKYSSV